MRPPSTLRAFALVPVIFLLPERARAESGPTVPASAPPASIEAAPPSPDPALARADAKASEPGFYLELRVPVARYVRRRAERDGGSAQLKTNVDALLAAGPALRLVVPVASWLALGGSLSGGVATDQVDGTTTTKTDVSAGLLAEARLSPWTYDWGYPHLTLGAGGLFVDGRYVETNASSSTVTGLLLRGVAELGFLFWIAPKRWAFEASFSGGYGFGPGRLHDGDGIEVFLQELTIDGAVGVTGSF